MYVEPLSLALFVCRHARELVLQVLRVSQEEWLRASPEPKYAHLREDLHVEVTAFAPPAEAHARLAYALAEVRKYIMPDSNDEIRQKQARTEED